MAAADLPIPIRSTAERRDGSEQIIARQAAKELVFGIVGHAGSGASVMARTLKEILEANDLKGGPYETELLKARDVIATWVAATNRELPVTDSRSIDRKSTR